MLSSVDQMIWRTQDVLHKKPQVVPCTLLAIAGSTIVYRHMTSPVQGSDTIKSFLTMVTVQMLPLVLLEIKIMSCADPVGLFCKFATPVTLIHALFLAMRLVLNQSYDSMTLTMSAVFLVVAIVTMVKGYRQSLRNIIECNHVWSLIAIAGLAAVATTMLDSYFNPGYALSLSRTSLLTANSYIEIVAFVPAVWMVFTEQKNSSRVQVESTDTKRTSTAFFLFLVGFYITEDVGNAYLAYSLGLTKIVPIAHILHFLLLVDFAVYVLAHIYNPEKLVGELRRWLPVDFYHEV